MNPINVSSPSNEMKSEGQKSVWLSNLVSIVSSFEICIICISILGQAISATAGGIKPSFDCLDANLLDEVTICQNEELALNDIQLVNGFRLAIRQLGKSKATQIAKSILVARQACKDDADCIEKEQNAGFSKYQENQVDIKPPQSSLTTEMFAKDKTFPLASCKTWDGTIQTIAGQNTDHAIVKGIITKDDLLEYCLRSPGTETIPWGGPLTMRQCVDYYAKTDEGTGVTATADCKLGKIKFSYGTKSPKEFTFVPIAEEANWLDSSETVPSTAGCASGLVAIENQFQLLCPEIWRKAGLK